MDKNNSISQEIEWSVKYKQLELEFEKGDNIVFKDLWMKNIKFNRKK